MPTAKVRSKGHDTGEHEVALRRQLRLPAGLHHRRRRLLADDRRAGDAVAGQHGVPVEHRRVVRAPVHVGLHGRELRQRVGRRLVAPVRLLRLRHHADALDRRRLHDQPLLRHDEAVVPVMRVLEARLHLLRRSELDGVRRVAPLVADVRAAEHLDARVGDVLLAQLRLGLGGEIVEHRRKLRHQRIVQRRLDRPLPERADVGKPHAVGREHAGEGMDQHRRHAERVRHQAGVLPARAAEAVERVAGHVVAALHRDLLDRVGHVLDRDLEEAGGDLGGRALVARGLAYLRRKRRELVAHHAGIQRLVLAGAEDVGEELGLQRAQHDVAVGDAERPAPPVARGARDRRPPTQGPRDSARHRRSRSSRRPPPPCGSASSVRACARPRPGSRRRARIRRRSAPRPSTCRPCRRR